MPNTQDKTPKDRQDKQKEQQNRDLDFHPIEIPGEPLSATIIRERRERPY
jgi:hypothetical protein